MTATVSPKQRIQSIDILRGLIMVIMALDHVRDFLHYQGPQFFPTNMATTTVVLFFTRWVTHFCAPVFVFLSGVSVYLSGLKRTKGELSVMLIKRGLWLMLTDILIITFIFTLDLSYTTIYLEVLWAIGCGMIILGLLIRAPLGLISVIGAVIFFGHDVIATANLPQTGVTGTLLKIFFTAFATAIPLGSRTVLDLYAIIPWTGVMLIGCVFGSLYQSSFNPERRKKILLLSGVSLTVLFIVLRYINAYGDPVPWTTQRNWAHTLLSFLNANKNPPSLVYHCMTLGPALILLSLAESMKNRLTAIFVVYGSVPFFFFIIHLSVIRFINIILFFISGFTTNQINSTASGMPFQPATFGYPLWFIYILWILVVAALYLPCKWYGNYKRTHRQWWLMYL